MRTRLKICCVSSIEEAHLAVSAGADAVGLVAEMPSGPGVIADELIRDVARRVPPPVSRFLLTSRIEASAVVQHVRATGIDTVQLVDAVPRDAYRLIRRETPHVRIVQVLHVDGSDVVADAVERCGHVDAILLDSGRPSAGLRELGGTGRVHDWATSRRVVDAVTCPVFLAGGLHADNVAAAIEQVRPYGLDVCTGVRTNGHLDPDKLARFVQAVRQADDAAA